MHAPQALLKSWWMNRYLEMECLYLEMMNGMGFINDFEVECNLGWYEILKHKVKYKGWNTFYFWLKTVFGYKRKTWTFSRNSSFQFFTWNEQSKTIWSPGYISRTSIINHCIEFCVLMMVVHFFHGDESAYLLPSPCHPDSTIFDPVSRNHLIMQSRIGEHGVSFWKVALRLLREKKQAYFCW